MTDHSDRIPQLAQLLAADVSEAEFQALIAEARALALADLREQLRTVLREQLAARLDLPAAPVLDSPASADPSDELAALRAQLAANQAWLQREDPPGALPVLPVAETAPAATTAFYLYAIMPAERTLPPLVGVGAVPVHGLPLGRFTLALSEVPLSEFGPQVLEARVADPAWLEPAVRAHHAVQAALLADGPLLPLRFATMFSGLPALAEMLETRAAAIEAALAHVRNREEWSVKLWLDATTFTERVAAGPALAELRERVASGPPGAAYMLQKQLDRAVSAESERMAAQATDEIHRRLAAQSADAAYGPLRDRAPGEPQLLLNAAYLIDQAALDRFISEADALQSAYAPLGMRLELSGPWPPYSFVDAPEAV